MQAIYRLSAIIFLCVVLGYLHAEEVFKHKEWNVPNHILSIGKLTIADTLDFISAAALFVKVTAKI